MEATPGVVLQFANCAPLAQLDRASGYEPEGREFESLRARHKFNNLGHPDSDALLICAGFICRPSGPPCESLEGCRYRTRYQWWLRNFSLRRLRALDAGCTPGQDSSRP